MCLRGHLFSTNPIEPIDRLYLNEALATVNWVCSTLSKQIQYSTYYKILGSYFRLRQLIQLNE